MKYNTYLLFILILLSLLLTGCLYPDSELEKNQIPYEDQLETVQTAVDNYVDSNNGLVPIRTKPSDTPIFEKYLIDFTKLTDGGFLSEIPGNAFEEGGVYQYVLITPEENPRVRLIDLRITEEIRGVNLRLQTYRDEHLYPPFGEQLSNNLYTIDYEKLGLESAPTVISPYSNNNLPIIMDVDGNLYVDYRMDLNDALNEYEHDFGEGDDIRYLLAENTPFVPAYSVEYTIKNNEPVFMEK